ncbi:putative rhamnogalacturonan acetylesterase [Alteracholeplasma palmae J233]|uniref:Putative rhamnogalacturonan acetylesterase n=1 Tax=Alteracholeplasma palmae (strain ATCC 49389 / J233) TaxID=1318466 RepID=U4KKY0_ALTPJ|nr:rhamnogalacturonan acetylesterase [Alteracholeplasma palmae]CCV64372.1 putative rhamnogalacturonan acetylesterase [Alteracholeplasma palmae J233]
MKIFITGDSTAAKKELNKRPETGWGEKLYKYLNEPIEIINVAQNGRSTKSFLNENRLSDIIPLFEKGDYLFIQFGHNDGKIKDPARFTEPFGEYQENLKIFINSAREKGVIPVIFSSVSRRKFLEDGSLDPKAVEDYPQAALELAKKENVVSLDLFTATQKLYTYLGEDLSRKLFVQLKPTDSKNYPEGKEDNTHFCDLGAKMIASLVSESILNSSLEFKNKIDSTKILTQKEIKEELEKKYLYE